MIALQQQLQEIATGLNRLSVSRTEARLREARSLARRGHYSDAQRLLEGLEPERKDQQAEALDLLARVFAQQGRFEQARAYWMHLLRAEPENRDAIAGLAKINRAAGGSPGGTVLDKAAIALALVAVLALIIAHGEWRHRSATLHLGSAHETLQGMVDGLDLRLARQDQQWHQWQQRQRQQLDTVGQNHGALTNELTDSLAAIETRLSDLQSGNETTGNHLARLERTLAESTGTLTQALQAQEDALGNSAAAVATIQDTLATNHQSAESTETENAERLHQIGERMEELKQQLIAIQSQIEVLSKLAEAGKEEPERIDPPADVSPPN